MVNDKRPRACLICKQRRIKCDQARPSCARCVVTKTKCKWLPPADKPNVQSLKSSQAVAARYPSTLVQYGIKTSATPNNALHDDLETQALAFFVRYYSVESVPDGGPNPGLFGLIMPAVSSSRSSAAALSVSTVALTVFSRWRMDQGLTKCVPKVLGQAIKSLSDNLQDQKSRRSDLTLLTTLLLHYHSAFESLMFSRKGKSILVHHLGALALVKESGHPSTWSTITSEFVGCIIHLEITAAIREQRQVHADVRYLRSVINSISADPSRYLDTLGIQVADLQSQASMLQGDAGVCASSAEIYILLDEIQRLDESLVLWQANVSRFWGPFNWIAPGIIFPPIQTFQGSCHVYTSITATRRINDSRSHRLTLAQISLKLLNGQENSNPESYEANSGQSRALAIVSRIQWLVDGICASIPFCLGNRSRVGTLSDFGDPRWTFPTCHDMSEMYGLYGRLAEPKGLVSVSDQYNHAVTQGSWLMLSNLALLIGMFLGGKILTASFPLRDGQLPWICHQYLRNLSLNSIKWTHNSSLQDKVLTGVDLPCAELLISEASRCVRRVSRGLQLREDP